MLSSGLGGANGTLTINKAAQTVAFYTTSGHTTTTTGNTVTYAPSGTYQTYAAGSQGGAITFASTTTGVCTINSSTGVITFVTAGSCVVTADAGATTDYADSGTTNFTLTINKAAQTVAFYTTSGHTTTTTGNTVTYAPSGTYQTYAAGSQGGAITFASTTTGVCTINSSTGVITFVTAGSCVVTADAGATTDYADSGTTNFTLTINKAAQTVAFYTTSGHTTTTTGNTVTYAPSGTYQTYAAGSQGGAITFASTTTGVCTINSSTGVITFVTAGSCVVTADAGATTDYADSGTTNFTLTINKAAQTVAFYTTSGHTTTTTGNTVTYAPSGTYQTYAAGSQGGAITFASTTTGVCTINSSTGVITFVTAGSCVVTADAGATTDYADSGTTNFTLTINQAANAVTFGAAPSPTYGEAPGTHSVSASATGGSVTYSSNTPGVCTVNSSSGALTIVAAGPCTIQASTTGNTDYGSASNTQTFSVNQAANAVTFGAAPSPTYGEAPGTHSVSASATGGSVTYSSNTPGVCTVNSSSGALTIVAAGPCTIQASTTGNTDYGSASNTQTFSVNQAANAVTFGAAPSPTYGEAPGTHSVSASATGGSVTYSSNTPGVCTVNSSSGALTIVAAGPCTIQASTTGNTDYGSASNTQTFSVNQAANAVTFGAAPSPTYGEAPGTHSVSASATGGSVTYSSNTPGVCTVNSSSGALTIVAAGPCTIQASTTGNTDYGSASNTQTFSVNQAANAISFNETGAGAWNTTTATVSGLTITGTAGTVTYYLDNGTNGNTSDLVCSVNPSTGEVSATGTGTCYVYATVSGDPNYVDATSSDVTVSFTKAANAISFNETGAGAWNTTTATVSGLTITGTAGTVTYYLDNGTNGNTSDLVCSVNPSTGEVSATGTGTCYVYATVSGDPNYVDATSSDVTVSFTKAANAISFNETGAGAWNTTTATVSGLTITGTAGTVTYYLDNGTNGNTSDLVCSVNPSTGEVSATGTGTCYVYATVSGDPNYVDATSSDVTVSFTKAANAISFNETGAGAWNTTTATVSGLTITGTAGTVTYYLDNGTNGNTSDLVCSVNPSTGEVSATGTGTCYVYATVSGDPNYVDATSSDVTVSFTKAANAISFNETGAGAWNTTTATVSGLTITGTAGTVTYYLDNGTNGNTSDLVCSVNPSTGEVSATGTGTCYVYATVSGDPNYVDATSSDVTVSFTKAANAISFNETGAGAWNTTTATVSGLTITGTAGTVTYYLDNGTNGNTSDLVCSVNPSTGEVSATGTGTCYVYATVSGDPNYVDATSSDVTVSFTKAANAISFNETGAGAWNTTTATVSGLTITGTAGTVTYYLDNGTNGNTSDLVCSVNPSTGEVSATGTGTCYVYATVSGDPNYVDATSSDVTVSFTKAANAISFNETGAGAWNTTTATVSGLTITGTAGTVTYYLDNGTNGNTSDLVCSVNPSTGEVSATGTGTCYVYATVSGDPNYVDATSSDVTVSFTKAANAISFNETGAGAWNTTTATVSGLTITGTAGTVTYYLDNGTNGNTSDLVCSVNPSTGEVSATGTGTCYVYATVSGDPNYVDATSSDVTVSFTKAANAISFNETGAGAWNTTTATVSGLTITGTAGTVTYYLDNGTNGNTSDLVCSVNPSTGEVSATGTGTCYVYATVSGDPNYVDATSSDVTVSFTKAANAISFNETGAGAWNTTTATVSGLTITGTAGTVTYYLDNGTNGNTSDLVCSVNPSTGEVSATGTGTCYVYATVSGDPNYVDATSSDVTVSFTKAANAISFNETGAGAWNTTTATVSGLTITGTAGTVTYYLDNGTNGNTSDLVCSVNPSTGEVSATGTGTCYVYATVSGDPNYVDATSSDVTVSFTKAANAISFNETGAGAWNTTTATVSGLTITGTAGTVTYYLDNGTNGNTSDLVCSVNPSTGEVSATGTGTCYVYATVSGDPNYVDATSSDVTVSFTKAANAISFNETGAGAWNTTTATVSGLTITGTAGTVTYYLDNGTNGNTSDLVCSVNPSTGEVSATGTGTCYVYATVSGDPNYVDATSSDVTVSFTKAANAISFNETGAGAWNTTTATVSGLTITGTAGTVTYYLDNGTNGNTSDLVCSVNPSTGEVSATGTGTCYVYATVSGDPNYVDATSSDVTVSFTKAANAISFNETGAGAWNTTTATVSGLTITGTAGTVTYYLDNGTNGNTSDLVCSVNPSTGEVSATGTGTCYVYATVSGDPNYVDATSSDVTVSFTKAANAISFNETGAGAWNTTTATVSGLTITGTAGTVTYYLDNGTNGNTSDLVCSVNPSTGEVSATGTGTCYVYATVSGDPNYVDATSSDVTVSFTKAANAISFNETGAGAWNTTTATVSGLTITGTAGTVTYYLDNGTNGNTSDLVCSVNPSTGEVSATGTGTCYVYATVSGDPNYVDATSSDVTVSFTKAANAISFNETGAGAWNTTTATVSGLTITGTAGTVTYYLDNGTNGNTSDLVCSVNPSTGEVSATGTGTCYVYATVSGDPNYVDATSSDVTVSFTKAANAITPPSAPSGPWTSTLSVYTTATSGLTVTYTLAGGSASGCNVTTGGVVSATGAGTCVIDLNQAGNGNYSAASQVQVTVNFAAVSQTITPPSAPSGPWTSTLSVYTTATSGLTVTYTLAGGSASGCNVTTGGVVSATGAGTCVIDLNQAGNGNYSAASQVQVTVNFAAVSQTITPPSAPSGPWTSTLGVYTTATSGLTVTYTLAGGSASGCNVTTGGVVSATGAGTCVIDLNQAGNGNYSAASQVQVTVNFAAVSQTITPPSAPSGPWTSTLSVYTTATSGLTVTYTLAGGSASGCNVTTGGVVSATGAGTCVIDLNQAGNGNYSAASQVQVTATFINNTVTVTFANGGGTGSMASEIFTEGVGQALTQDTFTRAGYTFSGWGTAPNSAVVYFDQQTITISASVTLYAEWTLNPVVTFNAGGGTGSMPSETFTTGTPQALTAVGFLNGGYTFAGWGTAPNSAVVYFDQQTITISASVTLYAEWTPVATTVTVTFNSEGGTAESSMSGPSGTTITLPTPTRSGYTFNGWFSAASGGTLETSPYTLTSSLTLYAQWTANASVTVTFNSEGGTAESSMSGPSGTTITLPTPTRSGYTFNGWFTAASGGTLETSPYTLTSSLTLYAQWTANASVTVTFNSEGGTAESSMSGPSGTTITLPTPTRSGYTFNGWFTAASGGTLETSPYTLTSSLTLYAQWTANASVTVTFNSEGGTAESSMSGPSGTTITLPTPTRSGYTFNGWFSAASGGTLETSPYTLTSSLTLYAQWTASTATTSTSVSENYNTRTYGDEDDVTLTATITGIGSNAPTGTVTFKAGSTVLCSTSSFHRVNSSTYTASCSLGVTTLPVGSFSVAATYSGDSHYTGSTSSGIGLTITKDTSHTSAGESASHALAGSESSVTFSATVTTGNGETVGVGDAVTIHVGSASCPATTNASGVASCTIANSALPVGTYSVSATLAGDANVTGSSSSNSVSFVVATMPVITSAHSANATVGHSFSFQVTSTGSPAATYTITGLPSGLTYNATTGLISGTPANHSNGTYTVTITATNIAGSTSQTFTLVVAAH